MDFSWHKIGQIEIESKQLRFPHAPESPGIYRFDLPESIYFGETDNLRRRFQQYRTPGVRQRTNLRLRSRLLDLLGKDGKVAAGTVTAAWLEVDGEGSSLDLGEVPGRRLVENAAIVAILRVGLRLENL